MKGNILLSAQTVSSMALAIEQLDASLQALKTVSRNIVPEVLITEGLKATLEKYSARIRSSTNLAVHLRKFKLKTRLNQDTEIVLFRIVQELLDNIIQHAKASEAWIQLRQQEDRFSLTVTDNGKGIEQGQLNVPGTGLAKVRAHAAYLSGTVVIKSDPGKGSRVTVVGKCCI